MPYTLLYLAGVVSFLVWWAKRPKPPRNDLFV